MTNMSNQKRTFEEVDPDYVDVDEQQTKRQRALEDDGLYKDLFLLTQILVAYLVQMSLVSKPIHYRACNVWGSIKMT